MPVKPTVNAELDRLRQLTAVLKQNLELCAKDATVDPVHDIRTGTRRIEAMLDAILRERVPPTPGLELENTAALREAAERWLRLLKRIRRTAAPVRDLDVHRKLLEKLKPLAKAVKDSESTLTRTSHPNAGESVDGRPANAKASLIDAPPMPTNPIELQADDLDAWLKQTRQEHAQPLMKAAPKWAPRVEEQLVFLEEAMRQSRLRRRGPRRAAVTALEAFARLANQMQQLDAGNLHDFRKGAKKARYMAEAGGDDEHAGEVGKALKRLQDEIGDWHDWLVLAEEAHHALGAQGAELTALIETKRDQHYALAMHISERMRGRLMGEWQALRTPQRARTRPPRSTGARVP
jgi:CHAD domain-containing protein